MRWGEEHRREEQARRQNDTGQAAAFSEGTPEWYIKKFMDRTVTPKQASGLQVTLRSKEMRSVSLSLSHMRHSLSSIHSWLRHFVEIQGTSVLGQALQSISKKGVQRCAPILLVVPNSFDLAAGGRTILSSIEYEVAKCLKQILNH